MMQDELGERAAAVQRRHDFRPRHGEFLLGIQTIIIHRFGKERANG